MRGCFGDVGAARRGSPAYLCGHRFQPHDQFHDAGNYFELPLTSRIAWVPITSTDPKVDSQCAQPGGKDEELDEFLLKLYYNMFSHEIDPANPSPRWYRYTRRSFAVLLEFLKGKIDVDWDERLAFLMNDTVGDLKYLDPNSYHTAHEIACQLASLACL